MNTVNVGNGLGELSLFSAALVLAIGLWTGQRQLGFQGMWRVLGTLAVTVVAAYLLAIVGWVRSSSAVGLLVFGLVSTALAFLPMLVAALQVGAIRDASRSDDSRSPLP